MVNPVFAGTRDSSTFAFCPLEENPDSFESIELPPLPSESEKAESTKTQYSEDSTSTEPTIRLTPSGS